MAKKKSKLTESDLRNRADAVERSKQFRALLEKAQAELEAKKTDEP
jgi:hypothetical protein